MLRDGLAAEFPIAARALAAIRRPRVLREPAPWAALSGFGAAWLTSTFGGIGPQLSRFAGFSGAASVLTAVVAIVATAAGVAVALRAGGRRALAYFLIVLALLSGLNAMVRLPGFLTFCERTPSQCSYAGFVQGDAYALVGALLGLATARLVVGAGPGANRLLAGGGAFSLASSPIGVVYLVGQLQDLGAVAALTLLTAAVAGFAAGIVVRARGAGSRPAIALGVVLLVAWAATYGPLIVLFPGPFTPVYALVGPIQLAALFVAVRAPVPR